MVDFFLKGLQRRKGIVITTHGSCSSGGRNKTTTLTTAGSSDEMGLLKWALYSQATGQQ
jgi:hypothetical protein